MAGNLGGTNLWSLVLSLGEAQNWGGGAGGQEDGLHVSTPNTFLRLVTDQQMLPAD